MLPYFVWFVLHFQAIGKYHRLTSTTCNNELEVVYLPTVIQQDGTKSKVQRLIRLCLMCDVPDNFLKLCWLLGVQEYFPFNFSIKICVNMF